MTGGQPIRPRRLRSSEAVRRLVRETEVSARQLVLPLFVVEGLGEPRPIPSMPGVVQHSRESLRKAVGEAATLGLGGVMLFGIPEEKDAVGSQALRPEGILNAAIADARCRLISIAFDRIRSSRTRSFTSSSFGV